MSDLTRRVLEAHTRLTREEGTPRFVKVADQ